MSKRKPTYNDPTVPPLVPIAVRNRRLKVNRRRTTQSLKQQAVEKKAYERELANFKPATWLIPRKD